MQLGFILSLIFAIFITVFAIANHDPIEINFIIAKGEYSLALVIFISAALGAIIVTLLGLVRQIKMTLNIKESKKKINELTEKNTSLSEELKTLKEIFEFENNDMNTPEDIVEVSEDIIEIKEDVVETNEEIINDYKNDNKLDM